MLLSLTQEPLALLIFAISLVLAITIHEASHALLADRLGDPTPRLQGRLTLNPLSHLDLIGTLMLFLVGFGWGKPVQFDPYNLRSPRRDGAIISFAGPASNLIFAAVLGFFVRVNPEIISFILPLIQLNIILAIFNLIPIHPLDGGKVLVGLLEGEEAREVDRFLTRYGLFLLILLVLPIFNGRPIISLFLFPLVRFFLGIFLGNGTV